MYFNINKTKRNFILYISALFDIGKLVKNMNINFDFSEKIKYLLDNTKNISLEKQNMYLNSNIINNNFKIIENELNSMYEKTRILEDIIDYMKLYINNEIENYMLDCRNLLKDIEVLSDINLKEEINYTAINVPFIYNTLEYIDRDGTVLKNCDIYNNKIVLSQNKDITVQINSVSIVRNEALFNLETINDNKDNIIYNKPYLIEYELDSIVNNGINELIRLNFNKEEIINTIRIDFINCNLKSIRYIYANNIIEEEENLNTENIENKKIIGIEFLINASNYDINKKNININTNNSFENK